LTLPPVLISPKLQNNTRTQNPIRSHSHMTVSAKSGRAGIGRSALPVGCPSVARSAVVLTAKQSCLAAAAACFAGVEHLAFQRSIEMSRSALDGQTRWLHLRPPVGAFGPLLFTPRVTRGCIERSRPTRECAKTCDPWGRCGGLGACFAAPLISAMLPPVCCNFHAMPQNRDPGQVS
jgi:hypothetical protein